VQLSLPRASFGWHAGALFESLQPIRLLNDGVARVRWLAEQFQDLQATDAKGDV